MTPITKRKTKEIVFELEEATEVPLNTNEVLCNKLLNLPSPKVTASRTGLKSLCMEHVTLLKKMDPKIFKENPENNVDCFTQECKHYKLLLSLPCKTKGKLKSKPGSGAGAYDAA